MATLRAYIHRGGNPVSTTVSIKFRNGRQWASKPTGSSGIVEIDVPTDEAYTVVIEPYKSHNTYLMPAHRYMENIELDLDKMGAW
jgi:hypothetical protein